MRPDIVAGQIYHVLSRGVDKRKIFLDKEDYFRFIHDLFEFNDEEPANNAVYSFRKSKDFVNPYIGRKPRKKIVKILAFCLMPNHYHLLLVPELDTAMTQFMRKLNIGYANYFNEKYDRAGTLFEGRYKCIPVTDESHFVHLPYYIHLNPLDLITPEWRERKITTYGKAMKFLESYRWSSHLDYTGIKNFPSVTDREFLLRTFGSSENYKKAINRWLKDLDFSSLGEVALEI